MLAIYKKELKQYFNSMIGFVFLALTKDGDNQYIKDDKESKDKEYEEQKD